MNSILKDRPILSSVFSSALSILIPAFLIGLWVPQKAEAVRPLYAPLATVAGDELHQGYRDGGFNTALFNRPLGLAVSDDGNLLFVADSGNNRIRVIHLDQNNEVTTLAGQDQHGDLDGPLTVARFSDPRGLLYLPEDRLAVNDFGNNLIRIVDLKKGVVSTFRGVAAGPDGKAPSAPSAAPPVPMEGIQGMAYLKEADSVLYTQPDLGALKRWNLKTGLITTVLNNNALVPHPGAVLCRGKKLFIAERDSPKVFVTAWKDDNVANLDAAGIPLEKIIALGSNDNILYGLLDKAGFPMERFILDSRFTHEIDPSNAQVSLKNSWGDTVPQEKYFPTSAQSYSPWMGFVADPSDGRKFYIAQPDLDMIVAVRDLFKTGGYNSNGLFAPEYPAKKPKDTYRVIIVGDSRTLEAQPFPFTSESHPLTHPPNIPYFDQNLTMSPQIERELNFQAALDDVPINYEVMTFGRHGDLMFWPTQDVPGAVQKNDIDLVVIFSPTLDKRAYFYYFNRKLSPEGIPLYPPDPEYLLKPAMERIPDGLPRKFFDYCKAHDLVKIEGRDMIFDDEKIMKDPQLHDWIIDFYGKPWDVLQKKISGMRTSAGKPVRLLVLCTYTGRLGSQIYQPALYQEAAKKYGIPFYDLGPIMNALHLSYFPLTGDQTHLNPDGCIFFGRLLAHQLVQEKWIPWKDEPEK